VSRPTEIIWNTLDYVGAPVELTTTVLHHAVLTHGNISAFDSLIRVNVEVPQMVVQSEKYADTLIYSRFGVVEGVYSKFWLHVPVGFQVGFGSVRSAYFAPNAKPGKIIYVKYKR
jgi:hypothetical protein